jgi:hypothetical protein
MAAALAGTLDGESAIDRVNRRKAEHSWVRAPPSRRPTRCSCSAWPTRASRASRQRLKIPGFSTYIHRMDERHLLTIGYDAADQGSFAYFTGVLLQIFDVSDPKAPRLAHRHVLGTRGTTSEALTNHLAFNYFPPKSYSRGWRHCSTGCPGACSAKL